MLNTGSKIEYFKTISSAIAASTAALDDCPEPYCMLAIAYKNGEPYDLVFLGNNKAFRQSVNDKVEWGQTLRSVAPNTVEFWLKKLVIVSLTGVEVRVEDYQTSDGKKVYGNVTAFPLKLLGGIGIGLLLENPKSNIPNKGNFELCSKCPNNPTVANPSIKLSLLTLMVDDNMEVNNCQACMKLQKFLSDGSQLR